MFIFNQDISYWNISKVENMSYMFFNATSFNQDISTWNSDSTNLKNVYDFSYMFTNATIFARSIFFWKVDTNKNINFTGMFKNAYAMIDAFSSINGFAITPSIIFFNNNKNLNLNLNLNHSNLNLFPNLNLF